jgi:hypothetical protein
VHAEEAARLLRELSHMKTSATLRVASVVDAPSTGTPGRGFRGGFRLAKDAAPVLVVLGQGDAPGLAGRVLEFSPEHLVMQWPLGRLGRVESLRKARLHVHGFESLSFDVRPGISNLRDQRGDVGLDVCAPTQEIARGILQRGKALVRSGLANVEAQRAPMREVVEGDRLRDVLDGLMRNAFEGTVRIGDYPVGRATLIASAGGPLRWRYAGPALSGDVRIEIPGYNSLFVADVFVMQCMHGMLGTSRPASVDRLRHRAHRRVPASDGLVVELNHPMWPALSFRRQVKEISAGGLSFVTDPDEDLLYPELLAEGATLYAGDRALRFTGEVRSISERRGGCGEYCGMRLMPSSAEDESVWQDILDEHLYPQTRKGAAFSAPTWDLYDRAGYFSLSGKSQAEFGELRRAFENVSAKLDAAPHLGCQVVWSDHEPKVEAALSMLKTYSTTWFGYQMAKVSGETESGVPGRVVLRDIHLHCYEHAQRDASMRWLIAIPQVKKVWSRLVHHDLPARYIASGQAAVVRFRAMEIACGEAEGAATDEAHDVGVATESEQALLLEEIARTRPRPYVEALDFVADRLDLAEITDDWGFAGLERRRTILVARRGGVPIAAAVLESAEEGSHLFRLLDLVRLFPLAAEADESAHAALLLAAREWFWRQGKAAFVAYLEDDLPLPARLASLATDLGLADFAILAADLVPELLEHVVEVTTPREPRGAAT